MQISKLQYQSYYIRNAATAQPKLTFCQCNPKLVSSRLERSCLLERPALGPPLVLVPWFRAPALHCSLPNRWGLRGVVQIWLFQKGGFYFSRANLLILFIWVKGFWVLCGECECFLV
ncbi:hypothetical protein BDV37DRAFT_83892 [Aspergillus pseudonomiae]|uniref:Uncharacterized protein n=1 Tax=Aspergillus pseudonomiae TaxID=1506151 RepID=A0A5N7DHI9_9EURO|nr:uncharacterized protein BDV37DRAFT_83892 [Aspergillus pseudonomiae]KAE8405867.1 hypothetical protein BDV37DRAFT_83892 [Aspergillus pseudonomiae]